DHPDLHTFPTRRSSDLDDEGNIWIALWGGSQVAGYTPRGEALNSIPLPASQPSCPAFIGPDARQMLVTSAAVDVDKSDQKDQSRSEEHTSELQSRENLV